MTTPGPRTGRLGSTSARWKKESLEQMSNLRPVPKIENGRLVPKTIPCAICNVPHIELVRNPAPNPFADVCPKCLRAAENAAAQGKVTLFVVIDEMKAQLAADSAPAPASASARLPCVCCGRSLVFDPQAKPDDDDATEGAASTFVPGAPAFVCVICYSSAAKIADELDGVPLYDPGDDNAQNGKLSEQWNETLRTTLYQMAAQGYLGHSNRKDVDK